METQQYLEEAKRKEKQGLWEEALLEYEKARVLDPEAKDILLSLSRIYLFRNKPIQSLEVLHSAKHLKDDADFLLQLSSTYMALNRFDDAERILLEALHQHATAPLLNNLGVVSIRLNKRKEAMDYLSKSLELDPKNINTWFNLATFYESQGDLDKTLTILTKAKEHQAHPDILERYVQVLSRKKLLKEAVKEVLEANHQFPKHLGLQKSKLKILFMDGRYDECMQFIQEMDNENTVDPEMRKEMLEVKEQIYFLQKNFDACLKTLDALLQLSQNNPVYYLRKAFVFNAQQDYRHALEWLSTLLKTPHLPPQLRSEGILMMKSIELENWKHFAHSLFTDTTFRDAIMQNPVYALQSRGIMLPEESVAHIIDWIKNPAVPKIFGHNDTSNIIN
jgi:tetratricopeptide (TPR) repeat protein